MIKIYWVSSVLNRLGKYDMIYCLSSLLYRLGQNILLERNGANRWKLFWQKVLITFKKFPFCSWLGRVSHAWWCWIWPQSSLWWPRSFARFSFWNLLHPPPKVLDGVPEGWCPALAVWWSGGVAGVAYRWSTICLLPVFFPLPLFSTNHWSQVHPAKVGQGVLQQQTRGRFLPQGWRLEWAGWGRGVSMNRFGLPSKSSKLAAIRNPEIGAVKVEVSPAGDLVWLERSLEVSEVLRI